MSNPCTIISLQTILISAIFASFTASMFSSVIIPSLISSLTTELFILSGTSSKFFSPFLTRLVQKFVN